MPSPVPNPFGMHLAMICEEGQGRLFRISEAFHFAWMSFQESITSHQGSTKPVRLSYPLGVRPSGQIMFSDPTEVLPSDLVKKYEELQGLSLPLTALYNIVTVVELTLGALARRVIIQFPKKVGDKKQIGLASVLSCDSIDAVRLVATEAYVRDLAYAAPRDQAQELERLFGIELMDSPIIWRYLEVKATRDIWIHNAGVANELYVRKAGQHARVRVGELLPMDIPYFLRAYETSLQLVELLKAELGKQWPGQRIEENLFAPKAPTASAPNEPPQ